MIYLIHDNDLFRNILRSKNWIEIMFYDFNKFNIKYEQQYRLNRIKKAPFDFYLSEYNILIEQKNKCINSLNSPDGV